MPYLKKLKIKGKEYWYLFHTIRKGQKFLKKSRYIGKELPKNIEQIKQDFLKEIKQPKIKDKNTILIESLTPLERRVLPALKATKELDKIVEVTKLKQVEVMRALQWLQNKELLNIKTALKEITVLDKKGKEVLEKGFPEKRFLKLLPATIQEIKNNLTQDEFNVSIGTLKQKQAIKINKKITITEKGKQLLKETEEEKFLKSLPQEKTNKLLEKRNLIKTDIKKIRTIELTSLGQQIITKKLKTNLIETLTPDMLSKQSYKNKTFRRYDITSNVPETYGGKKHFVRQAIEYARRIWLDMGFKEMTGTKVVTSFWNFDALFTAQDHPVRDLQDTFFIKGVKGKLPKRELVNKVKKAHESGVAGSKGWQYKWDEEEAKKVLIRTHTTCLSAKTLAKLKKQDLPAKFFAIGRNFRNETVDWSHGFEFNQTEGIVIDPNANLRHLIGYLKEFAKKMGFEKIRIQPAFFPYTSPSLEGAVWHEEKKTWIEVIAAGIFRPEVTEPLLGAPIPVLAWGPGFDRLMMMAYKIKDMRNIYNNDIKDLRNKKFWLK